MIDKNTFGDSPAAINLAVILKEGKDIKVQRKISSMLHQYFALFNCICDLPDKLRISFSTMIFDKAKTSINNLNVPAKIKSHALNILSTRKKKIINQE